MNKSNPHNIESDYTIQVITAFVVLIVAGIYIVFKRGSRQYAKALEAFTRDSRMHKVDFVPPLFNVNDRKLPGNDRMRQAQGVSKIERQFESYANTAELNYHVESVYGRIPNLLITPTHNSDNLTGITFYIPGTAFSGTNADIETTNATHLAHALNSKVLVIHHALAPQFKWPNQLNDVCDSIRKYIHENNPTSLNIAGYSIGGLLATLATIALREYQVSFNRLILFAPALDLTNELRNMNLSSGAYHHYKSCLPTDFQRSEQKIALLQRKVNRDDYFNNPNVPFKECVKTGFQQLAQNPKNLRKYSPMWFSNRCFDANVFPHTTIIVGEEDYFRLDSELFFEKLKDARASAVKIIIPDWNHFIMWKTIYPFYLAQEINIHHRRSQDPDLYRILNLDDLLNIKKTNGHHALKERNRTRCADELKAICWNFNLFKIHAQDHQEDDTQKLTEPHYTSIQNGVRFVEYE